MNICGYSLNGYKSNNNKQFHAQNIGAKSQVSFGDIVHLNFKHKTTEELKTIDDVLSWMDGSLEKVKKDRKNIDNVFEDFNSMFINYKIDPIVGEALENMKLDKIYNFFDKTRVLLHEMDIRGLSGDDGNCLSEYVSKLWINVKRGDINTLKYAGDFFKDD